MIKVTRTAEEPNFEFEVVVSDGQGQSRHAVTMETETYLRLAGDNQTPEQCVDAAFRFLLDREPKESILERFNVDVISRYFPEFESELPRYLQAG